MANLPAPLTDGKMHQAFSLADLPDTKALTGKLNELGINTKEWGKGNTKDVSKFWKEIKESEAGLEAWQLPDGSFKAVRTTHVLRAKVSSPDAYDRQIFLFNTWQQYGDGRKRTRNGLLSEKLTTQEMPLMKHLHDVCQRAVTEEEMQRIVDSSLRIGPSRAAPSYDPAYVCPLRVVHEDLIDHTIETEVSKSYPGLLTMYHLYTVDIVCEGLPAVDFNTLEFEHPDKAGNRKLKYIHAWVWLDWITIQRYLLDGSVLKERKQQGSFKCAADLEAWLEQFDVDLDAWGTGPWKSIDKLHSELEGAQTQLERWGRDDGVPLLMRVVHVLQMKVTSPEQSEQQKFLFQVWHQSSHGQVRETNRTMAKKLCTADLPFDDTKFKDSAIAVVKEQLSYLAETHVRLNKNQLPTKSGMEASGVKVLKVEFSDHRTDLEDSPSFKDIATMYHLYTVEVTCEGLPSSDFASIVFDDMGEPCAIGWQWVTWQQTLDILHKRVSSLERKEAVMSDKMEVAAEAVKSCLRDLADAATSSKEVQDVSDQLQEVLLAFGQGEQGSNAKLERCNSLPPGMVARLAEGKGVSDDFLDGVAMARQNRVSLRTAADMDSWYGPPVGIAGVTKEATVAAEIDAHEGQKSVMCSLICCSAKE